jgi:hypothetical protein
MALEFRKLWIKLTTMRKKKKKSMADSPVIEQAEWTKHATPSQFSSTEKWRTTLDGERPVSMGYRRDLSPMSEHTRHSYQGNHVGFRTSYEQARARERRRSDARLNSPIEVERRSRSRSPARIIV